MRRFSSHRRPTRAFQETVLARPRRTAVHSGPLSSRNSGIGLPGQITTFLQPMVRIRAKSPILELPSASWRQPKIVRRQIGEHWPTFRDRSHPPSESTARSEGSDLSIESQECLLISGLDADGSVNRGTVVENSILHHEAAAANVADMLGWVTFHEQEVSTLPRCNRTEIAILL